MAWVILRHAGSAPDRDVLGHRRQATRVVTSASSGTANVYPAGEVLGIVYAEEPVLTDVFEALPWRPPRAVRAW